MVAGYPARSLNANAASARRLTLAEGGANGLRFPGQVAQLVEHVTENHGVDGSIPPLATRNGSFRAVTYDVARGAKHARHAFGTPPPGARITRVRLDWGSKASALSQATRDRCVVLCLVLSLVWIV